MKYRYRNRKTGEMISTTNRIGGKNWEPVEEEIFEENPIGEEAAEEAPVEKPEASRRSKKQ